MRYLVLPLLLTLAALHTLAASRILAPDIKTLRVQLGDDFLAPPYSPSEGARC